MSDYYDDDYDDYIDDLLGDWLYVEDAYDEADELAERTCPSPPCEAYTHDEDVDPFEYFIDLDYLSDGYYDDRADDNLRRKGKRKLQQQRPSRSQASKRQRVNGRVQVEATPPLPNIIYVPQHQRSRDPSSYIPTTSKLDLPSVALFKDWEKRFADHRGLSVQPPRYIKDTDGTAAISHRRMPTRGAPTVEDGEAAVDDEEGDEEEGDDDEDEEGGGLELEGMKDIAAMLTSGHKDEILKMLEAKGIDKSVLDVVLGDLMEGKQREFDEHGEAEVEGDEDEEDVAEDSAPARANGKTESHSGSRDPVKTTEPVQNAPLPPKRKAGLMDFGDDDDDDDARAGSAAKRPKPVKKGKYRDTTSQPAPANKTASSEVNGGAIKRKAEDLSAADAGHDAKRIRGEETPKSEQPPAERTTRAARSRKR